MNFLELRSNLKDMYFNSEDGEAVVKAGGIRESYGTRFKKGVKSAKIVDPKQKLMRFFLTLCFLIFSASASSDSFDISSYRSTNELIWDDKFREC
jgi:hypothetical protein